MMMNQQQQQQQPTTEQPRAGRKKYFLKKVAQKEMRWAKGPSEDNSMGFAAGWQAAARLKWVHSANFTALVQRRARKDAQLKAQRQIEQKRAKLEAQKLRDQRETARREEARSKRELAAATKQQAQDAVAAQAQAQWQEWEEQRQQVLRAEEERSALNKATKLEEEALKKAQAERRAAKKAEKSLRRSEKRSSKRKKLLSKKKAKAAAPSEKLLPVEPRISPCPSNLMAIAMVLLTIVLSAGAYLFSAGPSAIPAIFTPLLIFAVASGRFTPAGEASPPPSPTGFSRFRKNYSQRQSVPVLALN